MTNSQESDAKNSQEIEEVIEAYKKTWIIRDRLGMYVIEMLIAAFAAAFLVWAAFTIGEKVFS